MIIFVRTVHLHWDTVAHYSLRALNTDGVGKKDVNTKYTELFIKIDKRLTVGLFLFELLL